MDQRASVITLGVADLRRAREFYQALGWRQGNDEADDVAFFQAGGLVFALWDRAMLAQDSAVGDAGGWGGVTLAHNVGSADAVNDIINEARAAGAVIGREPARTFRGGYSDGPRRPRSRHRRRPSHGGGVPPPIRRRARAAERAGG